VICLLSTNNELQSFNKTKEKKRKEGRGKGKKKHSTLEPEQLTAEGRKNANSTVLTNETY